MKFSARVEDLGILLDALLEILQDSGVYKRDPSVEVAHGSGP